MSFACFVPHLINTSKRLFACIALRRMHIFGAKPASRLKSTNDNQSNMKSKYDHHEAIDGDDHDQDVRPSFY